MNLPDHAGALADRRRHALERPQPHVADGENAGDGGLEVLGPTDQRPVVQQLIVAQIRPCDDKPVGVDLDVPWKPARAGAGANEHEEGVCLDDFGRPRGVVLQREALQRPRAATVNDAGAQAHRDVLGRGDLVG